MSIEQRLIDFIHKTQANITAMEYDGEFYHQTIGLKALGIKVCKCCGYTMPIEREYCKCGERVWVDSFAALGKEEHQELLKTVQTKLPRKGNRIIKRNQYV